MNICVIIYQYIVKRKGYDMRLILFAGICLIAESMIPCRAMLGETYNQCVTRYGESTPPKGYVDPDPVIGISYTFMKDEYMLHILFRNDIAVAEDITKKGGAPFTDQEQAALLLAEGDQWKKSTTLSDAKLQRWVREDGATATYDTETPSMLLIANKNHTTSAINVSPITSSHLMQVISIIGVSLLGLAGCYFAITAFWRQTQK